MGNPAPLTETETRVLDYIRAFISDNGYPPTRREIAKNLGWKSSSVGQFYIRRLVIKGWLTINPGKTRAMRIRGDHE